MASSLALVALFSLALFAGTIAARKDPGEYWQGGVAAARNEALVEAIENLAHVDLSQLGNKKITSDCHTLKKSFVTDFEPRPNASAYGDDAKLKEEDKTFMKDFEPRPNASAYGENTKQKEDKSFMKDFEPRPNLSAYEDNTKQKKDKSFTKDFEPRPNASAYGENDTGLKGDKKFDQDF